LPIGLGGRVPEKEELVKTRLPVVLSATALLVALLGSTPLGHAFVSAVPPLATHAKTADFAKNAGAVNGIKASKRPRAGRLVPLGSGGKFPASVGVAGPKGDTGATGPSGPAGLSQYEVVTGAEVMLNPDATAARQQDCPTGKVPLGGGFNAASSVTITESLPLGNGWNVRGAADALGGSFNVYVVCARVAP
jgi:hypothetical protein